MDLQEKINLLDQQREILKDEDINNFKEEAMKDFIFSWRLDW